MTQVCPAHPEGISRLLVDHSWNCCSSQLWRLSKTKMLMFFVWKCGGLKWLSGSRDDSAACMSVQNSQIADVVTLIFPNC